MTRKQRIPALSACFVAAVTLFLGSGLRIEALTINLSFPTPDPTKGQVTVPAAYQTACQVAATQLESYFTDNITINISVVAQSGTGVFGGSEFPLVSSSFTEISQALISHATSPNDMTSLGDLPMTDPTGGVGFYYVNTAQAKALGIGGIDPNDPSSDGTFTYGAGFAYTLDPAHRSVGGDYDFIGIAQHEMSEIMGRVAGLGAVLFLDGNADYVPYDLFRYSAPGVRSLVAGNNNYFSIDSGTTDLKLFNFPNGNPSDPQDWAPGTNDACNNASVQGQENDFSAIDITAMDVIGYTAVFAPSFTDGPPPATATVSTAYTFTYTAAANPSATTYAVATGSIPGGLTLTTAGVLSGTPNQVGTFSGTISATNSAGTTTQAFSITVSQIAQTISFSNWADVITDPTKRGPAATPLNDGVPNLIKYFYDIDPTKAMNAADCAALATLVNTGSTTTLTVDFREYAQQTGLTLGVETSSDLQTWTPVANPTFTPNGTDPITHDPLYLVQVPASGARQFVRLTVTVNLSNQ